MARAFVRLSHAGEMMRGFAAGVVLAGAMLMAAASAQTPAPQGQSVAETRWSGRASLEGPDLNGGGQWSLYFRSDGVLVYSAGGEAREDGHWRQRDALVAFETGDLAAVFVGYVRGGALDGAVYDSNGQQGGFSFRRLSADGVEFCPQNMVALRGATAALTCVCAAGIVSATVWGDENAYTDDSDICTAAVHAGVITSQAGGMIRVTPRPGLVSYPASSANGVTTLAYGAWEASYTVRTAK
jgi:hypothetical protein